MNNEIKAGHGYFLIDTPGLKELHSPKRKTDEHWNGRAWAPVFDDNTFGPSDTCRRKVDVGAGYRLLELGEKTQAGDEAFDFRNDCMWYAPGGVGIILDESYFPFRRRLATADAPWITMGHNYPGVGDAVWFVRDGKTHYCPRYMSECVNWTAWRPVKQGEIPAPPDNAAETAFKKWRKNDGQGASVRKAFIAGYGIAKEVK